MKASDGAIVGVLTVGSGVGPEVCVAVGCVV